MCLGCLTDKPLSSFHRHPKSRDGRTTRCASCINQKTKDRHQASRERIALRRRKWLDEASAMPSLNYQMPSVAIVRDASLVRGLISVFHQLDKIKAVW